MVLFVRCLRVEMDLADMRPITGRAGPAIGIGSKGCGIDFVTGLQKGYVDLGMTLFGCHKTNGAVAVFMVVPMHQLCHPAARL
ncbi:MAG: hypothetical protein RLZZ177_2394 [Pseudomonadota bacterium]